MRLVTMCVLTAVSIAGCARTQPGSVAPGPVAPNTTEPDDASSIAETPAEDSPAVPAPTEPAAPAIAKACATPDHAAFDFWVGEWVVKGPKGAVAGANVIEKAHRGCTLIEHWTATQGGTGTSVNYFDGAKKKWVQHWVDGTGGAIDLEGGLQDTSMILVGRYVKADGTESQLKGTWTPLPDGRVRQLFEESTDGGATWKLWFDGYYSRR